ncbi:MAG: nucleotidyl transferase AbiEii/AbiGii toxin family protein [Candidatus Taylorbacteria bacterium]|nr:nucleotidyl transferase AbiEii/AbiGii toxin family protein [Candidatus Taylorbacteria bacterium]
MIGNMHPEALNNITQRVWESCGFLKEDFYLAGGTALALQLGHRQSIDLDFFSDKPIKKTLLSYLEGSFRTTITPIIRSADELTARIYDVKVTFLHYPFPLLAETVPTAIVPLASVRDIASMKAYALGRRGTLKDYVDLHAIFSRGIVTLSTVITDANQKYGDAFNDRLFCEQLLYTDDIENEAIEWLEKPVSLEAMKEYFRSLIASEMKS